MSETPKADDLRMLVEIACRNGAPIDVVFEKDGDVRVSVYPTASDAEVILDCNNPHGDGIRTTGSGDKPPKPRR